MLWVDGRPEERGALEAVLAPLEVRWATLGALEAARDGSIPERPALILLDVSQHWARVAEAVRRLREVDSLRTLPLVLLTEEVSPARSREACALGAVDCLASPPEPQVLRAKVAVFVELARRSEELERTRAELTEREGRFRLVLEVGGLGHWSLELATMRLEVSEGCKANFGLPAEEDLSSYERLRGLIHPEDRPAMNEAVERSLATRQEYACDYRVVPPSGRTRWVTARGRVVVDAAGQPVRMVGITLDTTERMREARTATLLAEAGRLLSESHEPEELLRRVARLAISSMASYCLVELLQEEGSLRRVAAVHRDPSMEALMRRSLDFSPRLESSTPVAETLRQNWTQLYPHFTAEHRRRVALSPEHRALIEVLQPTSVLMVPMRTPERPWGVFTFVRTHAAEPFDERDLDVAEELARRATQCLEGARLLSTAREAVRRRDEFLSVASHELKTPLTPLSLRLQALTRSARSDGLEAVARRLPRELERMGQQVQRLSKLMEELLEVSSLGTDALALELEPVELVALMREVIARFEPEAKRAGCELRLGGAAHLLGRWDRARLAQVLAHLLSNAIKYGAGRPIHIELGGGPSRACVVVRDEGIGIEPGALPRLFGKFERAVSERNYGGLGLGLYISRRIVEALGGDIWAESTLGQGATFIAELPLEASPRG